MDEDTDGDEELWESGVPVGDCVWGGLLVVGVLSWFPGRLEDLDWRLRARSSLGVVFCGVCGMLLGKSV